MLDAIFFFVKRKNHKETALTIANIIIKENNDRKKDAHDLQKGWS